MKRLFLIFTFLGLFTSLGFSQASVSLESKNYGKKKKELGIEIYKAELDAITVGKIKLKDNKSIIPSNKLDLNTVWIVNPEYPNIPFGKIEIKNEKTLIDLSAAPVGDYYVQGKKNNIIVAYKLSKLN
jgi:hypothetical protein